MPQDTTFCSWDDEATKVSCTSRPPNAAPTAVPRGAQNPGTAHPLPPVRLPRHPSLAPCRFRSRRAGWGRNLQTLPGKLSGTSPRGGPLGAVRERSTRGAGQRGHHRCWAGRAGAAAPPTSPPAPAAASRAPASTAPQLRLPPFISLPLAWRAPAQPEPPCPPAPGASRDLSDFRLPGDRRPSLILSEGTFALLAVSSASRVRPEGQVNRLSQNKACKVFRISLAGAEVCFLAPMSRSSAAECS